MSKNKRFITIWEIWTLVFLFLCSMLTIFLVGWSARGWNDKRVVGNGNSIVLSNTVEGSNGVSLDGLQPIRNELVSIDPNNNRIVIDLPEDVIIIINN